MNLTVRRFIYLAFFAVFFMVAAGLLLYLQGYRYNSVKHKLERTGAIMVDSEPSGVNIFLNDDKTRPKTPTTLGSLWPKNYTIRLEADGYQVWNKQLAVKPSIVTFTGKVHLWPNPAAVEAVAAGQINRTELSPDRENLLYNINSGLNAGLWIINLVTGKPTLLDRSTINNFTYLEWSPSGRQFLAGANNNGLGTWQIYNLALQTWQKLSLPTGIKIKAVHWGQGDDEIYFSTPDEVYLFDRNTNTTKLVWRERLNDFRIHDGLIFALSGNQSSSITIKLLDLSNLQIILLDQPPGLSNNLEFLPAGHDWLPLFDHDRHSLYLLHSPLDESKPIRRLPEVTTLDWSPAYERVLLTNNIEIWDYQIKEDKLNFILRLGSPFGRTRYYLKEPYLLMAIDKEIWALELDSRDIQQRWLLARYDKAIEDIFLDVNGKTLTAKTADKLYRLNLLVP